MMMKKDNDDDDDDDDISVKRLSIKHVRRDMGVPYWYCYKIKQTLTFKIRTVKRLSI